MKVVITKLARIDLNEITIYSDRQWGQRKRKDYLNSIFDKFEAITLHPELAKAYKINSNIIKKIQVGKHIIFFRHNETELTILRILHQNMDIDSHLRDIL